MDIHGSNPYSNHMEFVTEKKFWTIFNARYDAAGRNPFGDIAFYVAHPRPGVTPMRGQRIYHITERTYLHYIYPY
jgi:hypothetical protein